MKKEMCSRPNAMCLQTIFSIFAAALTRFHPHLPPFSATILSPPTPPPPLHLPLLSLFTSSPLDLSHPPSPSADAILNDEPSRRRPCPPQRAVAGCRPCPRERAGGPLLQQHAGRRRRGAVLHERSRGDLLPPSAAVQGRRGAPLDQFPAPGLRAERLGTGVRARAGAVGQPPCPYSRNALPHSCAGRLVDLSCHLSPP